MPAVDFACHGRSLPVSRVFCERPEPLLSTIRRSLSASYSPPAPARITTEAFAEPVCRNCGAALSSPFCAQCGQKRAERFGLRDLGSEAWDKLRWFEGNLVKAGLRVVLQPGSVARDYVLGARLSHVHPLKLLLAAIVLLLLVIAQTGYLTTTSATLSRAVELVQSYSKWSFSLGLVAVLAASNLVFWRVRGFNFVEHLVLATYTHFVILAASIVSLSPLLFHATPELIKTHRFWSGQIMPWVEGLIVFLAFTQFFGITLRQQWWRPLLGAVAFVLVKKGLLFLYAWAVIKLVMAQLR